MGTGLYAAAQWGILTAVIKLGSIEAAGQFAFALAIAAPVMLFTDMALRAAQVTDASGAFQFNTYFGFRIITSACGFVLISLSAIASTGMNKVVIITVGTAKTAESLGDIVYGLLQKGERMDLIGRSLIIKAILSVGTVVLTIWTIRSLPLAVSMLAVISVGTLVFYDLPNGRSILGCSWTGLAPKFDRTALWRLLKLVWPLGVVMMLNSLSANIPRYFVGQHLGQRELGIFAGLAYLIVAGNLLVNALGQSASPRLAKFYAAGLRAEYGALVLRLCLIALATGAFSIGVAYVGGKGLLKILYRPEYGGYFDVFLWLLLAGGVAYVSSVLGYALTAARSFRVQPLIYGCSALIAALTCYALMPKYGLIAAAWSVLAANATSAVLIGLFGIRALRSLPERVDLPLTENRVEA